MLSSYEYFHSGGKLPSVKIPWDEYISKILYPVRYYFVYAFNKENPADLNNDGKIDNWDIALWFFGRRVWDLIAPPFALYPPGYGSSGPGSNHPIYENAKHEPCSS
jgi:hypothetical protein